MYLTMAGTWRRHGESWKAARGTNVPSFSREALPFPAHCDGLKGLK